MSKQTLIAGSKKAAPRLTPWPGLVRPRPAMALETAEVSPGVGWAGPSFGHNLSRVSINTSPAAQACPLPAGPRACPFGGACHTCPTQVQAKLAIGQPGDVYEQEADEVATRVLRMPDDQVLQRQCPNCEEDDEHILRATQSLPGQAPVTSPGPEAPALVREVLRSPGQPLDPATRAFMEPRFGYDFSQVRLHTDNRAAESARAVNALAYTAGHQVVFCAGQYAPQSAKGRKLLAHELTHVIQQSGKGLPDGLPGQKANTRQIQRQTAPEDDLLFLEENEEEAAEEETDSTEVHDGDSPVSATPDTTAESPEEESGLEATLMAQADLEEVIQRQAKGGDQKKSPKPPPAKKAPPKKTITRIEVDQVNQMMTVIWSDGTKEDHAVSTGKGQPNTKDDPCKTQTEKNCTPNGDFTVGTLGNGSTTNSHGDKMSWYVGFVDSRGIGIHDSQPVPGTPASHGCVRVGNTKADDDFARKVNKHVVPGTTVVHVSGKAPTKPWTKKVKAAKSKKKKKKK